MVPAVVRRAQLVAVRTTVVSCCLNIVLEYSIPKLTFCTQSSRRTLCHGTYTTILAGWLVSCTLVAFGSFAVPCRCNRTAPSTLPPYNSKQKTTQAIVAHFGYNLRPREVQTREALMASCLASCFRHQAKLQ